MKRREILKWIFAGGAAGVFGYMGLKIVAYFLPRPPKKVFVKAEELPPAGTLKVKEEFFMVRSSDGHLRILSRRCPHLGCTVNYSSEEDLFICPCHQSRFALTGAYLSGPAKKDLVKIKWEKVEGGIILEIPG